MWVRKIFKERKQKGEFHLLVKEMQLHDQAMFFQYFRMCPTQYEHLLSQVAPELIKSSQKREPIGPSERLCVALRYLFTGDSQKTISSSFRISPTSVGRIIYETTDAIARVLTPDYLICPNSQEDWSRIALEFEEKWQFNHCLGAIDGKHIVMQAPPRSGSLFFNYKKTHSLVLMAVCDANYRFTMVDVGDTGRNSDAGVFANSDLGKAICENTLQISPDRKIWNSDITYPFVYVGDEAFPLRPNLMKPDPRAVLGEQERIFNYRLSRCRRVIENTFGILASRFRIFRRPIIAREDVVIRVTKACVVLHNYLMHNKEFKGASYQYLPPDLIDRESRSGIRPGTWRGDVKQDSGLRPLQLRMASNNYSRDAKTVRENFKAFFQLDRDKYPGS